MKEVELLIERLNQIKQVLDKLDTSVAFISLGSSGKEQNRLDQYSDLDFFVIVQNGYKQKYIDDLSWLENACAIPYKFLNTDDGYKLFFDDGVFCEFAVFDIDECQYIPNPNGNVLMCKNGYDIDTIFKKENIKNKTDISKEIEWMINETLTNIFVGLGRYHRGEMYSAYNFIENYSAARILKLMSYLERNEKGVSTDKYDISRRYEKRCPTSSKYLSLFIQGYDKVYESAYEIYSWIKSNYKINLFMQNQIEKLLYK